MAFCTKKRQIVYTKPLPGAALLLATFLPAETITTTTTTEATGPSVETTKMTRTSTVSPAAREDRAEAAIGLDSG